MCRQIRQRSSIDIVLVHGTTQGPQGWGLLARELTSRGHTCHVIDLDVVLSTCASSAFAESVATQVVVRNPVVVAHSGSGLLLGAISQALDASHQVFLAAAIPDGRQSLMSDLREHGPEMFNPEWLGKDPIGDVGVARKFLFHDCDEATVDWALTTLRLFYPASVYDEVVPLDVTTPATAVVPRSDRTLQATWMERAAADRLGITPTVIDGGHCPHVSRPFLVADILDTIGNAAGV